MSKLKQKHIESFLQDMSDFQFGEKDKLMLEQHMTPPNIAAQLLYYVYKNQPIEDYVVADLGTGTGMLICGMLYIGAAYAIGIELDQKYVQVTQKQLEQKVEGAQFDLYNANAANFKMRQKTVDLVVMNPPFGTKDQGIDTKFLQLAFKICSGNIYSMHKSSTRNYLVKYGQERGYKVSILMEVKFPLKKRFNKYHKKDVAFTEVDILLFAPLQIKSKQ